MKKFLVSLFAICLAASTFAYSPLDFGVKAGANLSTLSDITDSETRTGFYAGVFTTVNIPIIFDIQVEALYSQQGVKSALGTTKLNYFNVPVLMKFSPLPILSLYAGPQFGFLLNDNVAFAGQDLEDITKSAEVSIGLGASIDISKISIDLRYNFGVSDTFESTLNSAAKNRVIQLGASYRF